MLELTYAEEAASRLKDEKAAEESHYQALQKAEDFKKTLDAKIAVAKDKVKAKQVYVTHAQSAMRDAAVTASQAKIESASEVESKRLVKEATHKTSVKQAAEKIAKKHAAVAARKEATAKAVLIQLEADKVKSKKKVELGASLEAKAREDRKHRMLGEAVDEKAKKVSLNEELVAVQKKLAATQSQEKAQF